MAEKNILPNLEASASDGNAVLKGDVTGTGWIEKKITYPRRLHMGSGARSIVSHNPNRVPNGTAQHQSKRPDPVIFRVLLTETQQVLQPRRLLLGKTNGRHTRRILEKTDRNRKRIQLQHDPSRRTIDIQSFDSNHRQKLKGQDDGRKNTVIEKDDRNIQTEHLRRKEQRNTKPKALIWSTEKHAIKEEPQ